MQTRMRSRAWLVVVLYVSLQGAASASASTTTDIRGTFALTTSGGTGQNVIDSENCSQGTFSGHGGGNGYTWTDTGTINGDQFRQHEVYNIGYTDDVVATVSPDGSHISGTFSDSNGSSGSYDLRRSAPGPNDGGCGPPPPPPPPPTGTSTAPPPGPSPALRASQTQVLCNFKTATADFVCTASVGDASGQQPPVAPSGSVKFSATRGGFGSDTCTLMPTPSSGSVSSCSASYSAPPSGIATGTPPPVSASYSGDKVFGGGAGRDHTIPSAPTGLADPNDPNSLDTVSCPTTVAAHARSNAAANYINPTTGQEVVHLGKNCVANLIGATGRVVQVAGVLGGATIAAGLAPPSVGSSGGLGLLVTTTCLGAGQAAVALGDKIIHDPPDRHFRSVVRVAHVAPVRIKPQRGLNARTAGALGRLLTQEARLKALDRAMAVTIDRAGGARKAAQPKWLGVQTRARIAFSRQASAQALQVVSSLDAIAKPARRSPALSRVISARAVLAFKRQVAAHGIPRNLAVAIRRAGGKPQPLRAAIRSLPTSAVPSSVAAFLASPLLRQTYRDLAGAAFLDRYNVAVLAESRLR